MTSSNDTQLVSIIITTKNEEAVIANLLKSIQQQSYKSIEVLLVDNKSKDKTVEIAKKYKCKVFTKGPERSAQRNFGALKAKGKYLFFLDADMVLSKEVVQKCVAEIEKKGVGGIVVPEKSIGEGFWSKVKIFERSFYIGESNMAAARFYPKKIVEDLDGFDEEITGPEDWDFSQRVAKKLNLSRISNFIIHDEGNIHLMDLLKKKFYYAKSARRYIQKNNMSSFSSQTVFFLRKAFYKNPGKIITHPILFIGMIYMLTLELFAGGIGYVTN